MSKRHTSKPRRRPRPQVLEVRVMSLRIAWFGFLRFLGGLTKLAVILAVLAGTGWGVWKGIERAFYRNPDFRLQVIDLNPNPVIDEAGLAAAVGLDLTASLFEIDVDAVAAQLAELPEIASARAERHLPGTLMVRVTPRTPKAWISCPDEGISGIRRVGGMLVDASGFAYPCPELQLGPALQLPVIELPADETRRITAGRRIEQRELAHCFRLLDSAAAADPESLQWIESLKQENAWSLLLVTRDGTAATFGLGDHERQIQRLRAAVDHANRQGYALGTINLIPKRNIPVTLVGEGPPPKAVPVAEPPDRQTRDLHSLLNRN